MTREEAIAYGEDYLKDLISACCHIEEKHKDFVRMAIKALKQEPCEDAVSRKAVLKEMPVLWNGNGDKDYCMESLRDFVAELPPVTPTRKHGKWIKDKGDHMYHCTRCYTRWVHVDDMNYCPRCGADMRGGE